MTPELEVIVTQPPIKEQLEPRSRSQQRLDSPLLGLLEGAHLCPHLDLECLASGTVGE